MAAFYGDVLGLERLEGNAAPDIVFFRIAEGYGGHTQVLALFADAAPRRPEIRASAMQVSEKVKESSLHHIALTIPYAEQDAVMAWYESLGKPYRVEHFGWVGWRGIFTDDPEGNTVELVAYDPSLMD